MSLYLPMIHVIIDLWMIDVSKYLQKLKMASEGITERDRVGRLVEGTCEEKRKHAIKSSFMLGNRSLQMGRDRSQVDEELGRGRNRNHGYSQLGRLYL